MTQPVDKGKKIALGVGIAFGAFIALALIAAAVTPDSAKEISQPENTQIIDAPANPILAGSSLNTPAGINEALLVDEISYTLVESHTSSQIFLEKADGRFMVVMLTMLNTGDESEIIYSSNFKLLDTEGRSFDSDYDSAFLDKEISYSQLNPDVPVTGQLAFDIPLSSGTYILQISSNELFSTDKKYIMLGSIQADFTDGT